MGLFNFLKGKEEAAAPVAFPAVLGAPAVGTVVPMNQIPDEVFSQGILGQCCGVDPVEGKVYAPVNGKITQVADTLHAIGIEAGGIEILIHVGVDTVEMNGDGFSAMVKVGQMVRKGDLLLTMDLDKIRAGGYATAVIMAVTNTDDYAAVTEVASGSVQTGNDILQVNKMYDN